MPISDNTEDYIQFFYRGKESTRRVNALRFKYYCQWLRATPEQLIEEFERAKEVSDLKAWERKQVNRIIKFYNWLLESEEKSINYSRSCAIATLAFYKQNCQLLPDVVREFAPVQMATDEYRFTQDNLRKMFYLSDVEGKALISLAVCFAQSTSDFLKLEAEKMRQLIREAKDKNLQFIKWFPPARIKTSIQPRSFLTPECIESLDEYLKLLEKKHGKLPKYLWCNSKPDKHISGEGLNKRLRNYVIRANIETYGRRIHFNLFRKYFYTVVRKIDRDVAKILTGKKTSTSDMTYVQDLDEHCFTVFKVAYKHLSLNGDLLGKAKRKQAEEIKELKEAITSLQTELQSMRTRERVAIEKIQELTDNLMNLDEALSHHRSKEIAEIYEDLKQDLGIKIKRNTEMLKKIVKFIGYKEEET